MFGHRWCGLGAGDDGGEEPATYSANFSITGLDDCEFASITGTFDGWTGWGTALCDEGLGVSCDGITTATIEGLADGSTHEYLIICASGDGWWYDIWANQTLQPELGSVCDFLADEYANYGFAVNGTDVEVAYCAGTCDSACAGPPPTCADQGLASCTEVDDGSDFVGAAADDTFDGNTTNSWSINDDLDGGDGTDT